MIGSTRPLYRVPGATLAGLLTLAVLTWLALVGTMMSPLGALMMPMDADWSAANFVAIYSMWALMMAAMMLPSAVPMIATYGVLRSRRTTGGGGNAVFIAGYVLVWAGFSAVATLVHWVLQAAGMLSSMGSSTSYVLSGALSLLAGAYQLTPLKRVCLRYCRTPLGFLMTEWRDGTRGAAVMGIRHGLVCLGCCWALMGLLFTLGVMSLPWVGVLAVALATEKLTANGERVSIWLGIMLVVVGIGLIAFGVANR